MQTNSMLNVNLLYRVIGPFNLYLRWWK